ncbi:hypothetical protein [Lysinibacillus fusiformis]|uniref:hypothetical protein n=1 Tax=Lysinibacillus fusiformis TaxID=28031 RepID=UPI003018E2DF
MSIKNCFECGVFIKDPEDLYVTDYFEDFGDGVYCEACALDGALKGFDDPKLVWLVGKG